VFGVSVVVRGVLGTGVHCGLKRVVEEFRGGVVGIGSGY